MKQNRFRFTPLALLLGIVTALWGLLSGCQLSSQQDVAPALLRHALGEQAFSIVSPTLQTDTQSAQDQRFHLQTLCSYSSGYDTLVLLQVKSLDGSQMSAWDLEFSLGGLRQTDYNLARSQQQLIDFSCQRFDSENWPVELSAPEKDTAYFLLRESGPMRAYATTVHLEECRNTQTQERVTSSLTLRVEHPSPQVLLAQNPENCREIAVTPFSLFLRGRDEFSRLEDQEISLRWTDGSVTLLTGELQRGTENLRWFQASQDAPWELDTLEAVMIGEDCYPLAPPAPTASDPSPVQSAIPGEELMQKSLSQPLYESIAPPPPAHPGFPGAGRWVFHDTGSLLFRWPLQLLSAERAAAGRRIDGRVERYPPIPLCPGDGALLSLQRQLCSGSDGCLFPRRPHAA